jgi:DnaJ family protein C protein 19
MILCRVMRNGGSTICKALKTTLSESFFRNGSMDLVEARQILNVTENTSLGETARVFKRLFEMNSIENKGSPYIQSKVLGAYEVLRNGSKNLGL